MEHIKTVKKLALGLVTVLLSLDASAAIDNVGVLDNVLNRYSAVASTWATTITSQATWLFWTLALISMVWTFGMMALRKADIGEFFAEFIRFIMFTGFFWWLLQNGPRFAISIIDSLRSIGGTASGSNTTLSPSGIADIGFDIFFKVLDQSSVWSPVDSIVGIAISAAVLVILALIGVNMLMLLISGWILAYAGIFFLGFGGSRWTSDMAINYFKTVLSLAAQLFTMILLVGIGKSFIDQYYANMSAGANLKELGVMLIVAVALLALVNKVPGLIGGLAMGGGTHSLGHGAGAGAALGGAALGVAAVASAGAALAAGAASMAGGGQALMAAFSKASAAASDSAGSGSDLMTAAGGSVSSGGDSGNALASAMGDSSSSTQSGSASAGSGSGSPGDGSGGGGAPGEQKSGSGGGLGASTVKGGAVVVGTVANLAKGSWEVAKEKAQSIKDASIERVGQTIGGKIAAAINNPGALAQQRSESQIFEGNNLSAAPAKPADADSEVAAFRDKSSET